jgi:hypothetical protein
MEAIALELRNTEILFMVVKSMVLAISINISYVMQYHILCSSEQLCCLFVAFEVMCGKIDRVGRQLVMVVVLGAKVEVVLAFLKR